MAAEYDHRTRTLKSLGECEAAVGQRARLPLTGTIVDAGESEAGSWVSFRPDERWGFGRATLRLDLDPLEIIE